MRTIIIFRYVSGMGRASAICGAARTAV